MSRTPGGPANPNNPQVLHPAGLPPRHLIHRARSLPSGPPKGSPNGLSFLRPSTSFLPQSTRNSPDPVVLNPISQAVASAKRATKEARLQAACARSVTQSKYFKPGDGQPNKRQKRKRMLRQLQNGWRKFTSWCRWKFGDHVSSEFYNHSDHQNSQRRINKVNQERIEQLSAQHQALLEQEMARIESNYHGMRASSYSPNPRLTPPPIQTPLMRASSYPANPIPRPRPRPRPGPRPRP